jgi:hypothetical protein
LTNRHLANRHLADIHLANRPLAEAQCLFVRAMTFGQHSIGQ